MKESQTPGDGGGQGIPPYQPLLWEFFLLFHGTGVLKGHKRIQGQTAKEKLVPRSLHVPSRDECKPVSLTSTPPSLLLISSTLRPQPMSVLLGDPRDPYQSTCDEQLSTRFCPPLGPVWVTSFMLVECRPRSFLAPGASGS